VSDEVDGGHALNFFAHAHALAAEDALGRIAKDRRARHVEVVTRTLAGKPPLAHPKLVGQGLQLAVAVPRTVEAVVRMIGQEQFDDRAPRLHRPGRMGLHLHAAGHGKGTTGHQAALALDFHNAHAAGAAGGEALHVAQRRHTDACPAQRRQQHLARLGLDRSPVDFNGNHAEFLNDVTILRWLHDQVQALTTAPMRQASKQLPQPMHFSATI